MQSKPSLPSWTQSVEFGIQNDGLVAVSVRLVRIVVCVASVLLCMVLSVPTVVDAASTESNRRPSGYRPSEHLPSHSPTDNTALNIYYLPIIGANSPVRAPHPASLATDQSPTVYLGWSVTEGSSSDYRYQVYLEPENPNPNTLIADNVTIPYIDLPTLEFGTKYYWQVVTQDASGENDPGPVWSFTTMPPVPDIPDVDSMQVIPEGEFQMGCHPSLTPWPCNPFERPVHAVYLDSYEMSKYEVTNIQYRACVDAGACERPRLISADGEDRRRYFYDERYDYHPVVYVSWWDAKDYCEWAGMRLPTEAEWEKAARGIDMRAWPWGNEEPTCDMLNYLRTAGDCGRPGETRQVGSYTGNVSPYGLFDMAGNVKEWVNDKWADYYYQESPYYDPPGPEESKWFVMRGGCYREDWTYRLSTYRHTGHKGDAPLFRAPQGGFRCARDVAP
jgi:formylglycine-generating enzyme required for sulfatase activity